FVSVERPDEAQYGTAVEAQGRAKRRVLPVERRKFGDVDRVWDDGNTVARNTTLSDVGREPLADCGDRVGALEHMCLQRTREPISRAVVRRCAVVDGRVL